MEKHDPTFGDLNRLTAITQSLDERGLVLSLAAFADDALADLILAFMQPGKASKSLVEGFSAPLGTFSSRIKASYSLGLITDRQYKNLNTLKIIRNKFAHNWDNISFSDQSVNSHIASLKFSPMVMDYPKNSNDKLRFVISALLTEIRAFTYQITTKNLSAKTITRELVPGITSDVKDEIAECETNLAKIADELKTSKGERSDYLLAQRERWNSILKIIKINGGTRIGL